MSITMTLHISTPKMCYYSISQFLIKINQQELLTKNDHTPQKRLQKQCI